MGDEPLTEVIRIRASKSLVERYKAVLLAMNLRNGGHQVSLSDQGRIAMEARLVELEAEYCKELGVIDSMGGTDGV